MSKGPGRTQRAILVALQESVDGLTAAELAEDVWGAPAGEPLSHARQETIRRALHTLEGRGLVSTFYVKSEATPGETRLHLAASITEAGFDLAGRLRQETPRTPSQTGGLRRRGAGQGVCDT